MRPAHQAPAALQRHRCVPWLKHQHRAPYFHNCLAERARPPSLRQGWQGCGTVLVAHKDVCVCSQHRGRPDVRSASRFGCTAVRKAQPAAPCTPTAGRTDPEVRCFVARVTLHLRLQHRQQIVERVLPGVGHEVRGARHVRLARVGCALKVPRVASEARGRRGATAATCRVELAEDAHTCASSSCA